MKSRFIDSRNCHALLPKFKGISFLGPLEECLVFINDQNQNTLGEVDRVISHNRRTAGKSKGARRFTKATWKIAFNVDVQNCTLQVKAAQSLSSDVPDVHIVSKYEDKLRWKTMVPLQFLLKGWGDAEAGHQCYLHTIQQHLPESMKIDELPDPQVMAENEYSYVGITGRNWLKRLSEHLYEIGRGSKKKFHEAWRKSIGIEDAFFVSSLMDVNVNYEDAMNWEELYIDRITDGPNSLNMIPGGFKGLKFLHEHRLTSRFDISLKERDEVISNYASSRKGIPNPFIGELWKDDEHYLRVIGARSKTLSVEQVRKIRDLAQQGLNVSSIVQEVEALNEIQVKKVISGQTYKRVK